MSEARCETGLHWELLSVAGQAVTTHLWSEVLTRKQVWYPGLARPLLFCEQAAKKAQ